jgi:hypothetical protein
LQGGDVGYYTTAEGDAQEGYSDGFGRAVDLRKKQGPPCGDPCFLVRATKKDVFYIFAYEFEFLQL